MQDLKTFLSMFPVVIYTLHNTMLAVEAFSCQQAIICCLCQKYFEGDM